MTTLGTCECKDYACPACEGKCSRPAVDRVVRVDWYRNHTVAFCQECLEDAMSSGVFGAINDQLDNDTHEVKK